MSKEIQLRDYYDECGTLCNLMLNDVVSDETFIGIINENEYMEGYECHDFKVIKEIKSLKTCWIKIVGWFEDGEYRGTSFRTKSERPEKGRGWFKGMVAEIETIKVRLGR